MNNGEIGILKYVNCWRKRWGFQQIIILKPKLEVRGQSFQLSLGTFSQPHGLILPINFETNGTR